MDCGSTCSVYSYKEYCKIAQDGDAKLEKTDARVRLYDGSVILPLGMCVLNGKRSSRNYNLRFQVVESEQRPLLSAATSEQLGLLAVNPQESVHAVGIRKEKSVVIKVASSPSTQVHILAKYADVFTGLGTLPGKYDMAVQAQPCRVSVALKLELKKEIEELKRRLVIAKVTTSTEWMSISHAKAIWKIENLHRSKGPNRALQLLMKFCHGWQMQNFSRCWMLKRDFGK